MKKTKKHKALKVGIIGLGYVGGSVKKWFEDKYAKPVKLFFYDKYKKIGSVAEVNKADIIFVCVPTPYHGEDKGYDDAAVFESFKNIRAPKIVILKSTVLPGTTAKLQKRYPRLAVMFNPEFLTAKSAYEDFIRPVQQVIGYTKQSKQHARLALSLLPPAPYPKIVPATEAELSKYFVNSFLALRVIYANQIYDLCERIASDFNIVRDIAGTDPRVGTSHFDVFYDGYRGYGGLCLPKDSKSLIDFADSVQVSLGLLKKTDEINEALKQKQSQKKK